MISIQRGLEDFNELRTTIKGVKDINTLVELIYDNPRYNITNDLRDTRGIIDINYKSICATIQQKEDSLVVLGDVEVWDNDGSLDFVLVNMYNYSKYNTSISEDGKVYVKSSHPYDEEDYGMTIFNDYDEVVDSASLGVDSGTIGIFDKDYYEKYHFENKIDEDWYDKNICDFTKTLRRGANITDDNGVWVNTSYGEGEYVAELYMKDGEICGIEITC